MKTEAVLVDAGQIFATRIPAHTVKREPPSPPRNGHVVHLLAAAVIATNAAGNCLLRVGLSAAGPIVTFSPLAYLQAFGNIPVLVGVALLIVWLTLQLSLLSWADLSYVLPVTSASYVLIAIIGAFALDERVPPAHWAGIGLILLGVVIVGRTPPLTSKRGRQ